MANQTDFINFQDLSGFHDEIRKGLKTGSIEVLAENLKSWASRNASVPATMTEVVQTTGGNEDIQNEQARLEAVVPTSTVLSGGQYISSGFNLLRLQSNNGLAVKGSGNWWYFPCPKLTFIGYGMRGANGGIILTARDGSNIQNATVYYKPFSGGVPTSATDGTAVTPVVSNDIAFYTGTADAGWIIVSGITYADTCAHMAWSQSALYGEFVAPDDEDDGGTIISLSPLGTLRNLGSVYDKAEWKSNTQMTVHTAIGQTASVTWTDVLGDDGETYTHTATIAAMKSGGAAAILLSGDTEYQSLSVNEQVVSFSDQNATVASGYDIIYELANATSSDKTLSTTRPSVNDMGIEAFVGATGTAAITISYVQGIPDAIFGLLDSVKDVMADAADQDAAIDELTQALYKEQAKDPDMKYGQPRILWGNGTPAEANVPTGWKQFADGGYNWIGKPAFIGQMYINTAVTAGGVYIGYKKADDTLDWRTIVA